VNHYVLDTVSDDGREIPIACTLDGGGLRNRLEEFRDVFQRGLIGADRLEGGFRWRFRAVPGLEDDLRALAGREHACCRFFTFELFTADEGREIWWEIRAEPEAAPVVEEFYRLPDQLAAPDAAALDAAHQRAQAAFEQAAKREGDG
jgi:hypothetical protein